MSIYNKLELKNGQILTAQALDHIEDGIYGSNDVILNEDELCNYYAINSSGQHILDNNYSCTHYIDCKTCASIKITMPITVSATGYGLAFYDESKNLISFIEMNTGATQGVETRTIDVPENAIYFRTTFFGESNRHTYENFSCELSYADNFLGHNKYRPYQDGYIFFSQQINQSPTKYWNTEETSQNGGVYKTTTGVLTLPRTYSQTGKKTPLIVYGHGHSHYVYYGAWGATDNFRTQKQHWVDMGFAVMDCNGARDHDRQSGFNTGFCPQGINAYKKCVEYITEHYNIDSKIYIVCGSAGGPVGWNYCKMYPQDVRAAVIIAAWTDLQNYCFPTQKPYFVEYLGFNNTSTWEEEKTIGFNPWHDIISINNTDYCFSINTPLYVTYGSEDAGGFISGMLKMANALRNAGMPTQIRKVENQGHNLVSGAIEFFDAEIGNWLLQH